MNNFKTKIERWQRLVEITENASNAMHSALYPLLKIFSGTRIGEITDIRRGYGGTYMEIHHVDHASGGPYHHEIKVPMEVWDADDPIEAAHTHQGKQQRQRDAASRQAKIDQIARLTKELASGAP